MLKQSSPRPAPIIWDLPFAIAFSNSALCVIDLSPGTEIVPRMDAAGCMGMTSVPILIWYY